MERKKFVFYGLAMLVALALTVKVLIPASPTGYFTAGKTIVRK